MRPPSDNAADFLTRLSPFLDVDGGRNLNSISRELSMPYQTIRFRVLHLKDIGISIFPIINTPRLELERTRASLDLSSDLSDPFPFFQALHQAAGLHYFSRSLSSNKYDCEFLIPEGKKSELLKVLRALEEMSFVTNVSACKLLWKEVCKMNTKYFDYSTGQWDVDFSRLSSYPHTMSFDYSPYEKANFDQMDLLIIKSLQVDSQVKLVDLAQKLKVTPADVSYHLKNHVIEKKMLRGFTFQWKGSSDAWAKHTIMFLTYRFDPLSEESARHAISIFTSIPFIWNHMRGEDGSYMSELIVPVSYLPETLHYISESLRKVGLRPSEMSYPDWSCSMNYTIPYSMYDDIKGWKFNAEESLSHVIQMIGSKEK